MGKLRPCRDCGCDRLDSEVLAIAAAGCINCARAAKRAADNRECSVTGCSREKATDLLCHVHARPSMANEEWRPVPGWEGLYEVSNLGRVYSDHTGRILRPGMNRRHLHVSLYGHGNGGKSHRVHRLVMEAFVGPLPDGQEVRHLDDNPNNNCLNNLVYGTRSENMLDRVSNGTHHNSVKTHCRQGHEFTADNTSIVNGGRGRRCLECHRLESRQRMRRQRAAARAYLDQ